jgi:hypothetical protein
VVPTKPFGRPGGALGAMVGAGNRKPAPMMQTASDGLSALKARLAGAKKNKAMKPTTTKGRQKQDLSSSGSVLKMSQAAQQ